MLLGRDSPGKRERVERVRAWVHARSPWALAAGILGLVAPIDGLLILPALVSIGMGFYGFMHLRQNPHLLGHRLCALGMIGGTIGLCFAAFLYTWSGDVPWTQSAASSDHVTPVIQAAPEENAPAER